MTSPRRKPGSRVTSRECGSVAPMVIGFCLILLMALAGVVATSRIYVVRRALSSVADGAAVAAADTVRDSDVLDGTPASDIRVDGEAAQRAAGQSIAESGAADRLSDFRWDGQVEDGGRAVLITTSATVSFPLFTSLLGVGRRVDVTARAAGAD